MNSKIRNLLFEIISEEPKVVNLLGSYSGSPSIFTSQYLPGSDDDGSPVVKQDNYPLIHFNYPGDSTNIDGFTETHIREDWVVSIVDSLKRNRNDEDDLNELATEVKRLLHKKVGSKEDLGNYYIFANGPFLLPTGESLVGRRIDLQINYTFE